MKDLHSMVLFLYKKLGYYHALRTAQTDKNFDELCDLFKKSQIEYFSILQDFLNC